ncbi:hypothetical protein PGT21_022372 [Puccinia graminis f. sp. tritici]|uniref:Uncharacterized protein n=1 Tax=Puccinia graminis f. sp. tritici TaxID=56615 RepID=A0A5B0MLI9_PUCGR|nr:hypothetical protein PGT21_022372 [Puccinia graminis f. sp. tritici]KAA1078836.1 hypothetical protein PGTUg99_005911 [Puccinia graminis f. sp. tritici]
MAPFSIALSSLDIPLTPAGEARRSYTTSTLIFPHFRSPPLHSSVRFNARFDLLFASTCISTSSSTTQPLILTDLADPSLATSFTNYRSTSSTT